MQRPILLIALFLAFLGNARSQSISLFKEIAQGNATTLVYEYAEFNGELYFSVFAAGKYELWKTDGDPNNVVFLKQFNFGAPAQLTVLNNHLLFAAADSTHKLELWRTDGTPAGTVLVKDINPNGPSIYTGSWRGDKLFHATNDHIYFVATDGVHGNELWKSDGTTQGTSMVKDINPYSGVHDDSSGAYHPIMVMGNKVYFNGHDSSGYGNFRLYETDGTAGGTQPLPWITSYSFNGIVFKGSMYFTGIFQGTQEGLLKTDGTQQGTVLLSDMFETINSEYTVLNNKLYLVANEDFSASFDYAIVATDGTPTGTAIVKDKLREQFMSVWGITGRTFYLTTSNNKVFFSAYDGNNSNYNIWYTDGTNAATPIAPNSHLFATQLTEANGSLYFKGWDSIRVDLWTTNGTEAGTQKITIPNSDGYASTLKRNSELSSVLRPYKNHLYFSLTYNAFVEREIYRYALPTSIGGIPVRDQLSIFPNPATNTLYIGEKGWHTRIAEITGKTVMMTSDDAIDVSRLTPGLYLIGAEKDGKMKSAKFMKH